jgi:Bacterial pre-peptidase C-terminal domain
MQRAGTIALAIAAFVGLGSGCQGGGGSPPAGPDAPAEDARPPWTGACAELGTPEMTSTLPAHASGDITAGGADILAPTACATMDAPYGVQSAGDDEVIALEGLTAGMDYVVRVDSGADLSFYVVTGCSSPQGPSSSECLLYEDATTSGAEVGHFTAPAGPVWVVLDYYASQPPADGSFAVDVYRAECSTDDQCGGATPSCLDGRCVGCTTSFDCKDPAQPVCNTAPHTCSAGAGGCVGDDASPIENRDDGPAGARVLVPDATGRATATGHICNVPTTERDYYAFTVTQPGDDWEVQLSWSTTADLDLAVVDARGQPIGLSYYDKPEDIVLTYLPAGTYYVAVSQYAQQAIDAASAYTLRTARVADACTSAADCAAQFRNQIYRGACDGGACRDIDGGGALAPGAACDSVSDCATGSSCASFFFTAGADTRDVCGPYCAKTSDCAGLGAGYVCTTYLPQNFCVQRCTSDLECPVSVTTVPTAPPWARLRCDKTSGRCVP